MRSEAIVSVLLEACPSFRERYEETLRQWRDLREDERIHPVLEAFAQHLIGMLERGEAEALRRCFHVIERLHTEGDDEAQAAAMAILGDVQDPNLHTRTAPADFRPFLSPATEAYWAKMHGEWGTPQERSYVEAYIEPYGFLKRALKLLLVVLAAAALVMLLV